MAAGTIKTKTHNIHFQEPVVNPFNGYMQDSIQIQEDDYQDLKARADKAGLGVGRYVLSLLASGKSPFAAKSAKNAYMRVVINKLEKEARR